MSQPDPAAVLEALEAFMVALHTDLHDAGLESLVEMELTLSQARSIMILACAAEPLPINELAARLHLSVAAAGRNVDQLVRAGLVDRVEDEHDRRIKRISLSDRGRDQVHQFLSAKRTRALAFLQRLDPDDHLRLLAALTPILARLQSPSELSKTLSETQEISENQEPSL